MAYVFYLLGAAYMVSVSYNGANNYSDIAEVIVRAICWPILFIAAILDQIPAIGKRVDEEKYRFAYEKLLHDLEAETPTDPLANLDEYLESLE